MLLAGCGLPGAWAEQAQWRILDTGFASGVDFLAAWRAWKDDPQRPRMLHYAAIAARPVRPEDLRRGAASLPELQLLAAELAAQCWGLLPGFHRLSFEGGRVLLTLCVGDAAAMLRELRCTADSVFLGVGCGLDIAKAVARLCRRGTGIATLALPNDTLRELAQLGFRMQQHSTGLRGTYDPAWEPKVRGDASEQQQPGRCAVIGGGLAGAAAAASLARRGWQVQVLDAHTAPAQGTSSLPAGLMAPHQSPDDNLLSRLTRAGVRITLAQCEALLHGGQDWQRSGALEHRLGDPRPVPNLGDGGEAWACTADARRKMGAGLAESDQAWWHAAAAWIKPAALVNAWLAQPGITWRGGVAVRGIVRDTDGWGVVDAQGADCARADLVVVAAALGSAALLDQRLTLHPVRGQVSWGRHDGMAQLPPWPLNGHGHFLPSVPLADGMAWLSGSTYGRGETETDIRPADQQANLERLGQLAPRAAASLQAQFARGEVNAWTGVRCASRDRRPLVGLLESGLAVSTAMGSRGLTFAALCAELLAARLHGEPAPLPGRLADALDAARLLPG
ncbi:FAD-dependent 5-carboxymethylaminomethyl-2-thiouridine(34) oxidoreductase MnmC [Ramlibacter sp.]|uniref:FAD-dependent 5-carboxymethylaminomethyl-2-thiouridine(34) oxidoreductase MnmC n=1 Tax=Ramlibacter sp. TaxID=1917967 RepID=UPI00178ED581|nr:FAD-dependent 5-carboxymethylaminomethyl-2-thiouridine(34) oxidoreductase MnmC [Ramlibacter sp.]MBA2675040.1 FAD-dependent 5-carboxymethylaminomethyl-2-thiouridine(34) oxidoreductase MnmC [Ramlibacter sp.]